MEEFKMKRGDKAREKVIETIKTAFGADCVGFQDKKIYVNAEENGEKIQFAISITMPKAAVTPTEQPHDWSDSPVVSETATPAPASSKEDEEKVAALMRTLGITV